MKIFLVAIVVSFISSGCYSLVWTPRQNLPKEQNSSVISAKSFYDDTFSDYYSFYSGSPWWYSVDYEPTSNEEINSDSDNYNPIIISIGLDIPISPITLGTENPPEIKIENVERSKSTSEIRNNNADRKTEKRKRK